MADYEVSQEEMIQIANNFLLSSPPGEFMEVVTDVRNLLPDEKLINDTAPATFREYNTDQMLRATNGDHQFLITKYGEISHGEYLDPLAKQVVSFDHIRQQVTGQRGADMDSSVEAFRGPIDEAAQAYCGEYYLNGACCTYGAKSGSDTTITVCISSAKFNPNNFWNGRWRSVWTLTFKSGGEVSLKGNIRVNVHYYEDGNVQLRTEVTKNAKCAGGDGKTIAANAFKHIAKIEAEYQQALDHSYETMGSTTFKALRRVLPITRQKVQWDKIKSLSLSAAVGGK